MNLPDLVVSSIVIPNTSFYYGAVPWTWVSFTVTNAGTGPLNPLSLPTDPRGLHVLRADIVNATLNGVPTFRDGYFNIPISNPLGPGESVTFAFAVGQDEYWLPLGTWVIKVKVDSDEKVLEEDETNNVSDPLTFEVMEPPLSDLLIDFENEIVGFTPALPPLGVTYGFIYPGEIFVRESVGAAPNRFASFEALGSSAGPGAPDMHVKLLPRPTSGVYLVSWKGQFLTGASGGGVVVRDGSNRILGSMDFQDDGSVTYRGSAIGAYTMGSWQDFGMLVDLDNREVSYLIAGVIVHGPVAFVESSASAEIGRISVELFLDNSQTFWWDDVALTRR